MSQRKESAHQATYVRMEETAAEEPKARIQKIRKEGSRSTYVIIVNKDCLRSDSALRNFANLKQPAVASHVSAIPEGADIKKNLTDTSDRDFDSPTNSSAVSCSLRKHKSTPEDVKLNLTYINDEEYDSGLSSSSVFLNSERSISTGDSAIETDFSQNSSSIEASSHSFSNSCHSKMNAYVIPSPLVAQQKKTEEIQHAFPISTQLNANDTSRLGYSTPISADKTAFHPPSRKIVLVPDSNQFTDSSKIPKKAIHYTGQAVPLANKYLGTPVSIGYQRPFNPNAVPVFSDISPIQASGDNKFSPLSFGTFVPRAPSPKTQCAGDNKGPFTSTPVINTNPRIAHLKQESSTHRPVYIIPSPFSRKKSDNSSSASATVPSNMVNEPAPSAFCDMSYSGQGNNSSGFVSASDSLDKTDGSCSIQILDIQSLAGSKEDENSNDMNPEFFSETSSIKETVSSGTASNSGGQHVKFEYGESEDTGLGLDSEAEPCVGSSQDSESGENFDKGKSVCILIACGSGLNCG